MKTRLLALFVAVLTAGAALASSDPDKMLKSLHDYERELSAKANKEGVPVDNVVLGAKLKEMALKAIEGIEPSKVDPEKALAWMQLFVHAQKWEDINMLCDRFHESGPSNEDSFEAYYTCLNVLVWAGQDTIATDTVTGTIADMPIPSAPNAYALTFMAANIFAPAVAKEQGMKAVRKMFDAIEAKLPDPGDDPTEKYFYEMAKGNLITGYAMVYHSAGETERALKYLDRQLLLADNKWVKKLFEDKKRWVRGEKEFGNMTNRPAPGLEFKKEIGKFEGLEAWKGKVVLVDFFSHWCGPCITSFPYIRKMYDDLRDEGFEVVSVTKFYGYYGSETDLTTEQEFVKLGEFMKKHSMNWQLAVVESDVMTSWGVTGFPTTFLIDREGTVHSADAGFSPGTFEELRKKVEKLLKK